MATYQCSACYFPYTEADGQPDDGIAPGTQWEDVPEGWVCPDCGNGKEHFNLAPDSAD